MPLLRTFFWVRGWTALADVLAGYWLLRFVTGEAGDLLRLPMLAVAAVALAWAGPAWRDVLDPHDGHRPPLPDGASPTGAFFAAAGLTAAGLLCVMTGGAATFAVGASLTAVSTAAGLGWGRVDGVGAVLEGARRGLAMALGMSAHGVFARMEAEWWLPPALTALYATLTHLTSQQEKLPSRAALSRLAALAPPPAGDAPSTPSKTDTGATLPSDSEAQAAGSDESSGRRGPSVRTGEAEALEDGREARLQARAVTAVLAWSRRAADQPVERGLLVFSGLALTMAPPLAAWLMPPGAPPGTWPEGWIAYSCLGWLGLVLLGRTVAGWIRPDTTRRRRLVGSALGGAGLFQLGLVASAAHIAWRTPYPGFELPLPERMEAQGLAVMAGLALMVWLSWGRAGARVEADGEEVV